jgi:hypothetical protein
MQFYFTTRKSYLDNVSQLVEQSKYDDEEWYSFEYVDGLCIVFYDLKQEAENKAKELSSFYNEPYVFYYGEITKNSAEILNFAINRATIDKIKIYYRK